MIRHILWSADRNIPREDEGRDTVAIGTHVWACVHVCARVCVCVCKRDRHANTYTEANRTE